MLKCINTLGEVIKRVVIFYFFFSLIWMLSTLITVFVSHHFPSSVFCFRHPVLDIYFLYLSKRMKVLENGENTLIKISIFYFWKYLTTNEFTLNYTTETITSGLSGQYGKIPWKLRNFKLSTCWIFVLLWISTCNLFILLFRKKGEHLQDYCSFKMVA